MPEFTPRRRTVFLDALKEGQTIKAAAARAGVAPKTIYEHVNKEAFFADQIDKAKGEAEARLIDAITKSAHTGETITTPGGKVTIRPGDWRAAAWLLEHHPETRQKYAAIQKTQVGGDPDNPMPVQVDAVAYSAADFAEIGRALYEGGALPEPPRQIEATVQRVNGEAKG